MPRLPSTLLHHARIQNPLLIPLLRTCRDLTSARNELRWLREHVHRRTTSAPIPLTHCHTTNNKKRAANEARLRQLCWERGRGVPLQYILGSEYFGELEIQCRKGVLIPRPETADLVLEFVRRLRAPKLSPDHDQTVLPQPRGHLRILDLCSGTGCISFLLRHELSKSNSSNTTHFDLSILGVDISAQAINLARTNQKRLDRQRKKDNCRIEFVRADILDVAVVGDKTRGVPGLTAMLEARGEMEWDIVIANPPYISPRAFYKDTARSVRNHEPRLALIPPAAHPAHDSPQSDKHIKRGDEFYPHILSIASRVHAKILLVEVADLAQALRVASMASSHTTTHLPGPPSSPLAAMWNQGVEVWRDGLGDALEGQRAVEEIAVVEDGNGNGQGVRKIRVVGAASAGGGEDCRDGRGVFCQSEGTSGYMNQNTI